MLQVHTQRIAAAGLSRQSDVHAVDLLHDQGHAQAAGGQGFGQRVAQQGVAVHQVCPVTAPAGAKIRSGATTAWPLAQRARLPKAWRATC
jgi:hypothetical protein